MREQSAPITRSRTSRFGRLHLGLWWVWDSLGGGLGEGVEVGVLPPGSSLDGDGWEVVVDEEGLAEGGEAGEVVGVSSWPAILVW
jgi:hypothetical protein